MQEPSDIAVLKWSYVTPESDPEKMYLKSWWMDDVSLWPHLIGLYKRIWSHQIRRTSFHSRTHEDISGFSRFRLDHQLTGINHCWVNPTTFNQQRLRFLWTHNGVTPSNDHTSIQIFQKSSNKRDWNWAAAYQSWRILEQIFLGFFRNRHRYHHVWLPRN